MAQTGRLSPCTPRLTPPLPPMPPPDVARSLIFPVFAQTEEFVVAISISAVSRLVVPAALMFVQASAAAQQASGSLPLKHAPQPTTAAITPADLLTRLYIFADDSMMGREVGTPYHLKATAYI